jgi:HEAT repeat protein
VELLAAATGDPVPSVGRLAAAVLGGFGTDGIEKVVASRAEDRALDPSVRRVLVRALSGSDPEAAGPPLARLLSDPVPAVVAEAALVLGGLSDRRACPELIRLVEEGEEQQQEEAWRCLRRIAGEDFGYGTPAAREAWEAWWAEAGR